MIAREDLEQLELRLFEGEPWSGRSPRALTKARLGLFLNREGEKHERFFADPDQLAFFPAEVEIAPWKYQGAPLLVGE